MFGAESLDSAIFRGSYPTRLISDCRFAIGGGYKGWLTVINTKTGYGKSAYNVDNLSSAIKLINSVVPFHPQPNSNVLIELKSILKDMWDNNSNMIPKCFEFNCEECEYHDPHNCIGDDLFEIYGECHAKPNEIKKFNEPLVSWEFLKNVCYSPSIKKFDKRKPHDMVCIEGYIDKIQEEPKLVDGEFIQKITLSDEDTTKRIYGHLSNKCSDWDKFKKGQKVIVYGNYFQDFCVFDRIEILEECENNSYNPIRKNLPLKIRAEVLKRDNYACTHCGRTVDDGIKLEVDHKIPISLGGTDELDNLQTLCFECNRGKSNRFVG